MPNYRRFKVAGGTYFFTVVTLYRSRFLISPEARAALREAFEKVRERHPFEIDAMCCCQTIYTAFGPCREATTITRIAGAESKPNSRSVIWLLAASRAVFRQAVWFAVNAAFGSVDSMNIPFVTKSI